MSDSFSKLDLNLLVTLNELLKERSVTKVAKHLYLSQPAVSASLRRLRAFYQDPLLVRVGLNLELTALGEDLAPRVQMALQTIGGVLDYRQTFDPTTSERIFIVAMSAYIHCIFFELLVNKIRMSAPSIGIKLIPSRPRAYEYSSRDCELIIGGSPPTEDYNSAPFVVDEWCGVMMRKNGERISLLSSAEWSRLNWVRRPSSCIREYFPELSPEELSPFDSSVSPQVEATELPSPGKALRTALSVHNTDMAAFVQRRLANYLVKLGDFMIVESPFPTPKITERIWWSPTRNDDAGLSWMREELLRIAALL